jgi:hypothetical protein|tara:strand:+ start:466 stop:768 length:303 start_codon:yes stop_codon:yes gene_type:complete
MSNPFKTERKYGKRNLQNPCYCLGCNCKYNEKPNDLYSDDIKDYCRYLGYCKEECWDKLPEDLQIDMTAYAYNNGAKVKSNHKFFMENIKGFDKPGKCIR